jgi:hypothetical protein
MILAKCEALLHAAIFFRQLPNFLMISPKSLEQSWQHWLGIKIFRNVAKIKVLALFDGKARLKELIS